MGTTAIYRSTSGSPVMFAGSETKNNSNNYVPMEDVHILNYICYAGMYHINAGPYRDLSINAPRRIHADMRYL